MIKASELLKNGGIIGIIVSDNFLKDEYLNSSKLSYINCHFNFIGQIKLDSKTFKNVGVENFNTKIVFLGDFVFSTGKGAVRTTMLSRFSVRSVFLIRAETSLISARVGTT